MPFTTTRVRLAVALAAATSVAACGGAGGDAAWGGTVRDSAGIEIVENPAAGSWSDGTRWTLRETLRIGTPEGEPEYQFGQIAPLAGVAVDEAGTVFVLDQQAQEVRVFGSDGRFVRSFGGAGSGPGEIAPNAGAVLIGRGDTVLVFDAGNARFNRYLKNGTPIGSFAIDFSKGIPVGIRPSGDGRIMAQFRQFPFPGVERVDSLDHIVILNADGSVADSVHSFPSGQTFTSQGGRPRVRLFSAEPQWAPRHRGGLYAAVNDAFRITERNADGSVVRIVTKPTPPSPVTEADQSTMREAMIRLIRRNNPQVTPDQAQAFTNQMEFAPNFPAFFVLAEGPNSSLWAQRIQIPSQLSGEALEAYNPQQDIGSRTWDVFDSTGVYLGALTMPGRIQIMDFVGDDLYGVARDELDVQYVVRLHVDTN